MKNILINKIIKIGLLLYMFFNMTSFIFADIGGFNSYDDFGSSYGYSDGSSSIFGDYSSNYNDDLFGNSYNNDYYYRRNHSDSSSILTLIIIALVVIVAICAITYFVYILIVRKNGRHELNAIDDMGLPNKNINEILFRIKQNDIHFDEEKFEKMVKDVFIKLQTSWSERNIEEVREYETPELFEQHLNQINELKKQGKINKIEEIEVNHVHIKDYKCENDKEIITTEVSSRMKDYIIDEETKKVIKGNASSYWRMVYELKFARKIGTTKENNKNIICKNCGSLIEGSATLRCEHCGSVIVQDDYTWALASIENIKQNRL